MTTVNLNTIFMHILPPNCWKLCNWNNKRSNLKQFIEDLLKSRSCQQLSRHIQSQQSIVVFKFHIHKFTYSSLMFKILDLEQCDKFSLNFSCIFSKLKHNLNRGSWISSFRKRKTNKGSSLKLFCLAPQPSHLYWMDGSFKHTVLSRQLFLF